MSAKWLHLMLLFIISISVYLNTLHHPFVYDDEYYVVNNLQIRNWRHLPALLVSSYPADTEKQGLYRPLTTLSYLIDYTFWELNPKGYHFTNLILHSLNTLLVYFLVKILFPSTILLAFFSALFFALHPVHTEAVSWVVGRAELLAACFYFLTLLLWKKSQGESHLQKQPGWYLFSLGTFFLALLSKEIAITLPLLVFCISFLSPQTKNVVKEKTPVGWELLAVPSSLVGEGRKREEKGTWIEISGYLFVALAYLVLRYVILDGIGPQGIYRYFQETSLPWRLIIACTVFLYYVRLLLFPYPLNVDYVFPLSFFFYPYTLGLTAAFLTLYGLLLYANARQICRQGFSEERSVWLLSLCWIPLTLLPVLNLIPIGTLMAERFLYIPSFGFTLVAGWVITRGLESSRRIWVFWTAFFLLFLSVGYALQTTERNRDWRDAKSLWQQTVQVSPNSPGAHNNLGVVYLLEGDLSSALQEFHIALRLKPDYPMAYMNIGLILERQGDFDEAIRYHQKALALDPAYAEAHLNLGVVYFKKGWIAQAIAEQQEALRLRPHFAQAHSHLGLSYLQKGWLKAALEEQEKALSLDPFSREIRTNLGLVYYRLGRFLEAREQLLKATALDPSHPETFAYLGTVYLALGDISQAIRAYERALELHPGQVQAHQYLGIIYLQQQQFQRALAHLQSAVQFSSAPQQVQKEIAIMLATLQQQTPTKRSVLAVREASGKGE